MLRPVIICDINANRAKINKQQLWLLKENARAQMNQQKLKKKPFRFSKEIIFSLTLADCLSDYKVKFEFSNKDFAADKALR